MKKFFQHNLYLGHSKTIVRDSNVDRSQLLDNDGDAEIEYQY